MLSEETEFLHRGQQKGLIQPPPAGLRGQGYFCLLSLFAADKMVDCGFFG